MTQQLQAAEHEAQEMAREISDKGQLMESLTTLVQMKEHAARTLLEQFERQATILQSHGVSAVSVASVGEAYARAIDTVTAQMVVFARELSLLTHQADILTAYTRLSERFTKEVAEILEPYQERCKKAMSSTESMVFLEIYETYNNSKNNNI